jgi:hypothetical protein
MLHLYLENWSDRSLGPASLEKIACQLMSCAVGREIKCWAREAAAGDAGACCAFRKCPTINSLIQATCTYITYLPAMQLSANETESMPHTKRVLIRLPDVSASPSHDVVCAPSMRVQPLKVSKYHRRGEIPPAVTQMNALVQSQSKNDSSALCKSLSFGHMAAFDKIVRMSRNRRFQLPSSARRATSAVEGFCVSGAPIAPSCATTPAILPPPLQQQSKPASPISYHLPPKSLSLAYSPPPPLVIVPLTLRISPPHPKQRPVLVQNSISGWERVSKSLAKTSATCSPPSAMPSDVLALVAPDCDGAGSDRLYGGSTAATTPRDQVQAVWCSGGEVTEGAAAAQQEVVKCETERTRSPLNLLQPRDVPELRPRTGCFRGGGWIAIGNPSPSSRATSPEQNRFFVQMQRHVTPESALLSLIPPLSSPSDAAARARPSHRDVPRNVTLQQARSPLSGSIMNSPAASPELARMSARASAQRARGLWAPWSWSSVAETQRDSDEHVEQLVPARCCPHSFLAPTPP